MKILNTNTLSLALLLALGASSPVQAMSYARSAWDYTKNTRAAGLVSTAAGKVASGASFVGTKAKAGASVVAGKSVELAQAVKNARVWSLAYNKAVAAHTVLGNGMNKVSFGRFAGLQMSHPKIANAVMAATVAGATYAGYKGTKWAYNKAAQAVAARKQAQVNTEAPVVSVATAPVVAVKAVRFADLNVAQKGSVMNLVEHRRSVNSHIKAGTAYVGQKLYANVTPEAIAQELFGKVTA